jgi:hypothetical protein
MLMGGWFSESFLDHVEFHEDDPEALKACFDIIYSPLSGTVVHAMPNQNVPTIVDKYDLRGVFAALSSNAHRESLEKRILELSSAQTKRDLQYAEALAARDRQHAAVVASRDRQYAADLAERNLQHKATLVERNRQHAATLAERDKQRLDATVLVQRAEELRRTLMSRGMPVNVCDHPPVGTRVVGNLSTQAVPASLRQPGDQLARRRFQNYGTIIRVHEREG